MICTAGKSVLQESISILRFMCHPSCIHFSSGQHLGQLGLLWMRFSHAWTSMKLDGSSKPCSIKHKDAQTSGWRSKHISECKASAGPGPLFQMMNRALYSTETLDALCRCGNCIKMLRLWLLGLVCTVLDQKMTGPHMQGLLNIHQSVMLAVEHSQELLTPETLHSISNSFHRRKQAGLPAHAQDSLKL